MGEFVNAIAKFSEPITKLIDVTAKGIGKVYEPIHFVRMAKAKAKASNILADAIKQNSDVLKSCNFEGLEFSAEDYKLANNTINRFTYQEVTKQVNIETVLSMAYNELENEETCSSEPLNEDWILRFFNSIQDISNEQMQQLWAKILAGEIKQPNTYSLRTLEVLKSISQFEAEVFNKVTSHAFEIDGRLMVVEKLYKKLINESAEDLYLLEECGLYVPHGNSRFLYYFNEEPFILTRNKNYYIYINSNKYREIEFTAYFLTTAGLNLAMFVDINPSDIEIMEFASQLKKENKTLKISLHKIIKENNGEILESVEVPIWKI